MATTKKAQQVRRKSAAAESVFEWQGRDRNGRVVNGETRATAETLVRAMLRRQGITPKKIRKRRMGWAQSIKPKEIATFTRQLATMMKAGVPLVEALDSVGGSAGNAEYAEATVGIRQQVSVGTSLTAAMTQSKLFPPMVLQMCAIGEESGSIDYMLGKAADFYESEVDDMVAGISSLMEPIIIVILGGIIGGIVVAMYLPIFKMGQMF